MVQRGAACGTGTGELGLGSRPGPPVASPPAGRDVSQKIDYPAAESAADAPGTAGTGSEGKGDGRGGEGQGKGDVSHAAPY